MFTAAWNVGYVVQDVVGTRKHCANWNKACHNTLKNNVALSVCKTKWSSPGFLVRLRRHACFYQKRTVTNVSQLLAYRPYYTGNTIATRRAFNYSQCTQCAGYTYKRLGFLALPVCKLVNKHVSTISRSYLTVTVVISGTQATMQHVVWANMLGIKIGS